MTDLPGEDEWTRRLGGRWLVSWQLYAIGTPLAFIGYAGAGITRTPSPSSEQQVAWCGVVAIACVLVGAWMFLADRTFLARRAVAPVPAWLALGFLGSCGALFTATLVLLAVPLGALPVEAPFLVLIVAIITAIWWGCVLVLLLDARDRISLMRAAVIDAAVEQEIASIEQMDVSRLLRDYLDTELLTSLSAPRERLDAALTRLDENARAVSWVEISDDLRLTARASVRALSSQLWEEAEREFPRIRLTTALPRILRTEPLRPVAVGLLTIAVIVVGTTQRLGPVTGLIASVLGGIGVGAVLWSANAAMRLRPTWRPGILIATVLLLVAGGAVASHVTGAPVTIGSLGIASLVTVVLLAGTSALGAVYRANAESMRALAAQVDEATMAVLIQQRQLARIARQAAQVLHGQVQTRLIACAAAIDRAEEVGDTRLLARALREARDILEQPLSLPAVDGSLVQILERHRRQWDGIVDIAVDGTLPDDVDERVLLEVALIIEEGIANAFRHGDARQIRVSVDHDGRSLLVTVVDDGVGLPDGRVSGTGSALIARVATQGWTLGNRSDGQGVRLTARIEIPQSAGTLATRPD